MSSQNKTQKQRIEEQSKVKKRVSRKQREALRIEQKKAELTLEFRTNAKQKPDEILWQVVSEKTYVKTRIEEDISKQLKVPRGIYQEVGWTERNHKIAFLKALKTTSPHIFEELCSITTPFKNLFGEISCELNEDGQSEQMGVCLKKISQLEEEIHKRVTDHSFIMQLPDEVRNINYPRWKRTIFPLRLCKIMSCSQDKFAELKLPQNQALNQWFSSKTVTDYDLKNFNSLFKDLEQIVVEKFQSSGLDDKTILSKYLTLQTFLFDWMEKYHLEKHWLLGVAYSILCQFTSDENIPIENLVVFLPQVYRELEAEKFKFEMEGWWAGKISAKEYKKQLLAKVKKLLPEYFDEAYYFLDLGSKKQITKPKDPTYKGIYFLIAWNEGATNPQIAECFTELYKTKPFGDDIKDATNALLRYNLPKRVDKPGRKSSLSISNERVKFIKSAMIKNLEKEILKNSPNSKFFKKILQNIT